MRWRIATLVFAAIAISYLDRQALPVAVAAIQKDIPLTNTQFGGLNSMFLLAYALMYAGGGALIDRLGTRRGFAIIMIGWSLACASHSLAGGVIALGISRFLLGAGEGGGFPAATKVIAEWFPVRDRSTAMGMVNAGTAVGAVIAPPAIAAIVLYGHWRWVFVACGAVGLIWSIWWLIAYPSTPPPDAETAQEAAPGPSFAWSDLLRIRQVRGLVFAKFLTDAAWFFYISWLPKYLYDARGFDTKQVGYYAWVPFAAAGIGSLLGGWLSSRLIASGKVGRFLAQARARPLGGGHARIIFVTQVPVEWAIVLFSLAFFGQQSWSTLVMIVPTDLFERRIVASVAGLVGFGGAMGGLLMNQIAGRLLDLGFGYQTGVFDRRSLAHHRVRRHPDRDSAHHSHRQKADRFMKITEVRTRVVEWRGPTVPPQPHFCTNPMDLLSLSQDAMAGFRFHGWVIVEIFTDAGHVGIGNAALSPR
jgi:ACS family hexuronate transporter-like MFS transporter